MSLLYGTLGLVRVPYPYSYPYSFSKVVTDFACWHHPQAHVGILAAQHLLSASSLAPAHGGPPGAAPAPGPALPYNPSAELAAAGPARLLLAVAGCLRQQYNMHEVGGQYGKEDDGGAGGRPDAALLESASALLERVVLLYGRHLAGCRDAAGGVYGSAERRELELLAAGALGGRLPKWV